MCGKVKKTSIVPFTAGSGISYSGEYNNTGRLEFVDIFFFLKVFLHLCLRLFGTFLGKPYSELRYELSDFFSSHC